MKTQVNYSESQVPNPVLIESQVSYPNSQVKCRKTQVNHLKSQVPNPRLSIRK